VLFLAAHGLPYGVASPGACLEYSLVSVSLGRLYADASGYRFPDSNNDGVIQADASLTGDLTNWLDDFGIPAITVLLSRYEQSDFAANLAGLTAVLSQYTGPLRSGEGSATLPTPTVACRPIAITWPTIYEQHQMALGCATQLAQQPSGATQRYANGRMIWRSDSDEVYVLYDDKSLLVYVVDTFAPYQETDMLKGAFGLVWNTKPGVSAKLGEPQEAEYVIYDVVAQDFQNGTLLSYREAGGIYLLLTSENRWSLTQE
jgi:hypothetical protein